MVLRNVEILSRERTECYNHSELVLCTPDPVPSCTSSLTPNSQSTILKNMYTSPMFVVSERARTHRETPCRVGFIFPESTSSNEHFRGGQLRWHVHTYHPSFAEFGSCVLNSSFPCLTMSFTESRSCYDRRDEDVTRRHCSFNILGSCFGIPCPWGVSVTPGLLLWLDQAL